MILYSVKKKKFIKRLLPWKVKAIGRENCARSIGLTDEYFFDENQYGINPLPKEVFYKVAYPEWEQFMMELV